ncbi:MAG: type V CRISPR-associated protein Cas12a/Cpf1, partial [Ignavibacteria bacterium]|nr:type V CRISPR-associated protein Cas12a/Cpf1 [Ignavibacteria bacterium]
MGKSIFDKFTNQYSLHKTLRYELVPQGKTEEHIKLQGLLRKDEERGEDYKRVKLLLDEIHKEFIEEALKQKRLKKLPEYYKEYIKPERNSVDLKKIAEILRKEIADWLAENPTKEPKQLVNEKLPVFLRKQGHEEEIELANNFKNYTTYFRGFNENRENIYTHEAISTSIAFRIVNDNLPKFLDNMKIFNKLAKETEISFHEVNADMKAELGGKNVEEIFKLEHFNDCIRQTGIDKYNAILGGKVQQDGKKIQGINERINLYRQKNKLTKKQVPNLIPLYKQILSDRIAVSYLPEQFQSSEEVLYSIKKFHEDTLVGFLKEGSKINILECIQNLLNGLDRNDYELSNIYINSKFLNQISHELFEDWVIIRDALRYSITNTDEKQNEKQIQKYLNKNCYSISELESSLTKYSKVAEIKLKDENPLLTYLKTFRLEDDNSTERTTIFASITAKYIALEECLKKKYEKTELIGDKNATTTIKSYLDALLQILHTIQPMHIPSNLNVDSLPEKDTNFYGDFDELYDRLSKSLVPLYNKVRSFLTQKPYSSEKIKLNFNNVSLLDGWDVNKETQNTAVILRQNGFYYLGIMDKKHNKLFENSATHNIKTGVHTFEKMKYKLLPGPNKMLPHAFLSKKGIDHFNPTEKLQQQYKLGTHKKGDNFSKTDCHGLIDYFKKCIKNYPGWADFDFKFTPTVNYDDLSGFYREVEHQGYKISFEKLPAEYIESMVAEGKLFLFKIYNKDFSDKKTAGGKANLHTLYWNSVFDPENLKDVVFKLNGQAEVFYRKKSILDPIVHLKNSRLKNKNENNTKKESSFKYDIIKDRRFTKDKFLFHVPITINFKCGDKYKFNELVNEELKKANNVNLIGIDRGERNLVYYSVINQKSQILDQGTLNSIQNENKENKYKTDYLKMLDIRESERDKARKSWQTIGRIKELKEGYISQVVHKLVKLMLRHNAVIVLEDLNFGFKRGRMKVEKQVYQKLEKMLIDKLNYLVLKDYEKTNHGGLLNGYQLCAPFTSFRDMGKQSGFIFYVPAANTSKIDFATGFVNILYPKYENITQIRDFLNKFEEIVYNSVNDYFAFKIDYNRFREKKDHLKKSVWSVCTAGDIRYTYDPKKRVCKEINATERLKDLFRNYSINYESENNLKEDILNIDKPNFFKELVYILRLVL